MTQQSKRSINGVLLLDKPSGLSSNAALQTVKRLYEASKAGHTGSLDPLASGLLPICLGEATKLSAFLLSASKTYHFVCRLGVVTSTGDAEGEVIASRPVGTLSKAVVEEVLSRFIGEIQQIPPMYSALKYQGKRLYKLARQGLHVQRQPRKVIIHDLRLLNLEADRLDCQVHCSTGTYVRTLAEHLGEALGCGAHVIALRRTRVGPFDAPQMLTLEDLQQHAEQDFAALDALLLPVDAAIRSWPAVQVQGACQQHLLMGRRVSIAGAKPPGWVRLYGDEDRFLGIGEALEGGWVAPRRLIHH